MVWIIASIPLWLAAFVGTLIGIVGCPGAIINQASNKLSRKEAGEQLLGGIFMLAVSSGFAAAAAWMCS